MEERQRVFRHVEESGKSKRRADLKQSLRDMLAKRKAERLPKSAKEAPTVKKGATPVVLSARREQIAKQAKAREASEEDSEEDSESDFGEDSAGTPEAPPSSESDSDSEAGAPDEEELEEESSGEDSSEEASKVATEKRFKADGAQMLAILEDIRLGGGRTLPWEERLDILGEQHTKLSNVNNDMERELLFYTQALDAFNVAVEKFEAQGVPWKRPDDYYAEMVKSDDHMGKIRRRLAAEKVEMDEMAERKRTRELKRFGKKIQSHIRLEREKQRRAEKDSLKQWLAAKRKGLVTEELPPDHVLKAGKVESRKQLAVRARETVMTAKKRGRENSKHSKKQVLQERDSDAGGPSPKRARSDFGGGDSFRGSSRGRGGRGGGGGRGGRGGGRGGRGGNSSRGGARSAAPSKRPGKDARHRQRK